MNINSMMNNTIINIANGGHKIINIINAHISYIFILYFYIKNKCIFYSILLID